MHRPVRTICTVIVLPLWWMCMYVQYMTHTSVYISFRSIIRLTDAITFRKIQYNVHSVRHQQNTSNKHFFFFQICRRPGIIDFIEKRRSMHRKEVDSNGLGIFKKFWIFFFTLSNFTVFRIFPCVHTSTVAINRNWITRVVANDIQHERSFLTFQHFRIYRVVDDDELQILIGHYNSITKM